MAKEEIGTSILDWPDKLSLKEWGATIPEKIRGILKWETGDDLHYSLNLTTGELMLKKIK